MSGQHPASSCWPEPPRGAGPHPREMRSSAGRLRPVSDRRRPAVHRVSLRPRRGSARRPRGGPHEEAAGHLRSARRDHHPPRPPDREGGHRRRRHRRPCRRSGPARRRGDPRHAQGRQDLRPHGPPSPPRAACRGSSRTRRSAPCWSTPRTAPRSPAWPGPPARSSTSTRRPKPIPRAGPARVVSPDAVAALLYTSGSTGRPKGVPRTHRNLLCHVGGWTNAVHVCPQDRMTLLASGTGQAVGNILVSVLNGASLYPFDVRDDGVPRLARWLIEKEVTFYLSEYAPVPPAHDQPVGHGTIPEPARGPARQ